MPIGFDMIFAPDGPSLRVATTILWEDVNQDQKQSVTTTYTDEAGTSCSWSRGVRALCIVLLRTFANQPPLWNDFEGEEGSLQRTLYDTVRQKRNRGEDPGPTWMQKMFRPNTDANSYSKSSDQAHVQRVKRFFSATKRGPHRFVVRLNKQTWLNARVRVFEELLVSESEVSHDRFKELADDLDAQDPERSFRVAASDIVMRDHFIPVVEKMIKKFPSLLRITYYSDIPC